MFIPEGQTTRLELHLFFENDWFKKIGKGQYIITSDGLKNQQDFRKSLGINHTKGSMTRFVAHNSIIKPSILQFTSDWNHYILQGRIHESTFSSGVYCQVGNQPGKRYFPIRDTDGLRLVENGSSTEFQCELPELLECIRRDLKTQGKETHIFGTFCQNYESDVTPNIKQILRNRDRKMLNQQRNLTGLSMKPTRSLHYNNSYYNVSRYFKQRWDELPDKDKPLIERKLRTFDKYIQITSCFDFYQNNRILNTSILWDKYKSDNKFKTEVIKTNIFKIDTKIALTNSIT